jgi:hypothetical protein
LALTSGTCPGLVVPLLQLKASERQQFRKPTPRRVLRDDLVGSQIDNDSNNGKETISAIDSAPSAAILKFGSYRHHP